MSDTTDPGGFQPRIVAFFCNWCTYTASDLAGISRMTYAPNTRVIRLMCSGRFDPQFILAALRRGADGVLARMAGRARGAHPAPASPGQEPVRILAGARRG